MNVNPLGQDSRVPISRSTTPGHHLADSLQEPGETFTPSSLEVGGSVVKPVFLTEQPTDDIRIVASPEVPKESLERLRKSASKAMAYFREHFGPTVRPLKFEVGKDVKALRTGYNFESDSVCLPYLDKVKNAGLDSVDIINHEIFHALLSAAYPQLTLPEQRGKTENERLHEGLADFFAHQLNPDELFGEDYFVGKDGVREYRSGLHVSLSAGGHAQGNALTSLLLEQGVDNQQVKDFLENDDFRLEALGNVSPAMKQALEKDASLILDETVVGYPTSRTGRYHLQKDVPLEPCFVPNDSLKELHPDLKVVWTDKQGMPSKMFIFQETGSNSFSISAAPEASTEKMIARFYDGQALVGFRPFYFGTRD